MNRLGFALLIIGTLLSCSQDVEFDEVVACTEELVLETEQYPQTWRLVKMTGSMVHSETTGEAMSWQELIELNADNTFKKTRKRDGKTNDASGTYAFVTNPTSNSELLVLTYSSGKDLIGSCTSITDEETYFFKSKCTMLGTWSACDGPGLEYERQVSSAEK